LWRKKSLLLGRKNRQVNSRKNLTMFNTYEKGRGKKRKLVQECVTQTLSGGVGGSLNELQTLSRAKSAGRGGPSREFVTCGEGRTKRWRTVKNQEIEKQGASLGKS